MTNKILNKPNQLISILPEKSINLIQQKSYNIFLRNAQRKVKFSDKYKSVDKEKRYIFKIPCKELKQKAGLGKKYYKEIKEELKKLIQIIVEVVDSENKENWAAFSLLESIEKIDDIFEYSLNWRIIKALKEHNFFTSLDLMQIRELKSKYSVVLYELAIRYQKYKIPKMSIEELRKRTGTENKYKQFYNFRRRVLDVACEEISEKTDINLFYSTEKRGRRIAFIDFKIEKKPEELPRSIEVKEQAYSSEVLELFQLLPNLEQVESNKKELDNLLKDHSLKYLKADIDYAKQAQPDNFMGFLKASCQGGHYSTVKLEKKAKQEELAKRKEEEQRKRKELEERIDKKAKEMAVERYELLAEKELEKYNQEYDKMTEVVPEKFRPNKEDYIIGALEDKFKEELMELFS